MPRLLGQLSSTSSLTLFSAETPVQQFFLHYGQAVDSAQSTAGTPLKYYSENVIFHNQKMQLPRSRTYVALDAANVWTILALAASHSSMWEIEQDNGESLLTVQMTRNVWVSGQRDRETAR